MVERNELKNKPFSNSKSGQHTTIGTVHGPPVSGQSGSLVLSRPQVRDLKNQKTKQLDSDRNGNNIHNNLDQVVQIRHVTILEHDRDFCHQVKQ